MPSLEAVAVLLVTWIFCAIAMIANRLRKAPRWCEECDEYIPASEFRRSRAGRVHEVSFTTESPWGGDLDGEAEHALGDVEPSSLEFWLLVSIAVSSMIMLAMLGFWLGRL